MVRRRIPFEGNDAQYVSYLEDIILGSQLHRGQGAFQPQTVTAGRSDYVGFERSYTPPASEEDSNDESSQTLQIIECKPGEFKEPPKKQARHLDKRVQQELDTFIAQVPDITDFDSTMEKLGLGDNQTIVSGLINGLDMSSHDAINLLGSCSEALHTLREYALFTKKCNDITKRLRCLAQFQGIVFISLCDVVLGIGEARDRVYEAMQIYISNSHEQHLRKIIAGARWVNRCIVELSTKGWGSRSSEIFLINDQSVNFYARYAASGVHTRPYFLGKLENQQPKTADTDFIGRFIISIPCIIKVLLGDITELSIICEILGYDYTSTLNCYHKYYTNLKNREGRHGPIIPSNSLSKSSRWIPSRKRRRSGPSQYHPPKVNSHISHSAFRNEERPNNQVKEGISLSHNPTLNLSKNNGHHPTTTLKEGRNDGCQSSSTASGHDASISHNLMTGQVVGFQQAPSVSRTLVTQQLTSENLASPAQVSTSTMSGGHQQDFRIRDNPETVEIMAGLEQDESHSGAIDHIVRPTSHLPGSHPDESTFESVLNPLPSLRNRSDLIEIEWGNYSLATCFPESLPNPLPPYYAASAADEWDSYQPSSTNTVSQPMIFESLPNPLPPFTAASASDDWDSYQSSSSIIVSQVTESSQVPLANSLHPFQLMRNRSIRSYSPPFENCTQAPMTIY